MPNFREINVVRRHQNKTFKKKFNELEKLIEFKEIENKN